MKKIYFLISFLIVTWFIPRNIYARMIEQLVGVIYGNEQMFNQPQFAFFDEDRKRLYVADTGNNRLVSFNKEYKYLAEFTAEGRLHLPIAMVRDRDGRIIVNCAGDNKVLVIYLKEKKIKPLDFSNFSEKVVPYRLALEGNHLYVLDRANKCIFIFTLRDNEYVLSKWIKEGNSTGFNDIKVKNDYIYTLDPLLKCIFIYTPEGQFVRKVTLKGMAFPVSLAVDGRGWFYVLDKEQGRVFVFNGNGEKIKVFAKLGWKEGALYYPQYLFLDMEGKIFVVDTGNGRVEVFRIR